MAKYIYPRFDYNPPPDIGANTRGFAPTPTSILPH